MPWERFNRLLSRYPLAVPRVVHSIYAANLGSRGTGCGKSARPELWGVREGNFPDLPGSPKCIKGYKVYHACPVISL